MDQEDKKQLNKKKYATADCLAASDLKSLRKDLGVTQRELADLIQCSKSTVERWEMCSTPITGPVVLLAQMLQKHPEYLEEIQIPEKKLPLRLWYMFRDRPCTLIDVNEIERKVQIWNYTDQLMFRAFGSVENPDYAMYEEFLESRCFPAGRDKMKLVLKDLELPFYDPLLIIEKTEGRMAEDEFWIRMEQ